MNQVTEMFRLNDTARTDEALVRLSGLFDVMAQQPGFLHAEVTREVADAKTLLVFHAWSRLEDWQAFQTSEWKLDFMARRPEGLYSPAPVGMNWTLVSGDQAPAGRYIRRAVSQTEPTGVQGQLLRAAGDDDSYPAPWMTLEYSDAASGGDGWFEVLHSQPGAVVAAWAKLD
jgi:heme-degrading monooxygenase HmoA